MSPLSTNGFATSSTSLDGERDRFIYPSTTVRTRSQVRSIAPILITFDAFDTLFKPRKPIAEQYADVTKSFGLELEEASILSSFKDAFRFMNTTYPNYGKHCADITSPRLWWENLIAKTLDPLLPSDSQVSKQLKDTLYERFSSSEGYVLFDDVIPLFETIKGAHRVSQWTPRSTMLGVISNSDPRAPQILQSLGLRIQANLYPTSTLPSRIHRRAKILHSDRRKLADLAFVTLSYDTGVAKPDSLIFEFALNQAQEALDSMASYRRLTRTGKDLVANAKDDLYHLHIGNELEKDVLAATRAGWDALLLDRSMESPISEIESKDGKKITVINSLDATILQRVITRERMASKTSIKA